MASLTRRMRWRPALILDWAGRHFASWEAERLSSPPPSPLENSFPCNRPVWKVRAKTRRRSDPLVRERHTRASAGLTVRGGPVGFPSPDRLFDLNRNARDVARSAVLRLNTRLAAEGASA